MSKTIRDQYADALIAIGYTKVPSKSTKYWCFSNGNRERLVFLGKAGAFRIGHNASHSLTVSPQMISKILKGEA